MLHHAVPSGEVACARANSCGVRVTCDPTAPPAPSRDGLRRTRGRGDAKKSCLGFRSAGLAMERLEIEHVPAAYAVYAAFFRDLSNAAFLQSQLLGRNPDFEYAFVDAAVVVSRNHLLAAIFKAVTALADGALKTPNVHSEIVWSLSPSNNVRPPLLRVAAAEIDGVLMARTQISEAYRRYGITPDTKNVLVVKVVFPTEKCL